MGFPLITNMFCSVLISTNTICVQPESIHDDLIVDQWVGVFADTGNCKILSPKETTAYWQAELYAWDDYGLSLSEWGLILYKYRLKKILRKIEARLEELEDLKREILDMMDMWDNP